MTRANTRADSLGWALLFVSWTKWNFVSSTYLQHKLKPLVNTDTLLIA